MDETERTLEFYRSNAKAYAASTVEADLSDLRERFLAHVPDGGLIVDAGWAAHRLAFLT